MSKVEEQAASKLLNSLTQEEYNNVVAWDDTTTVGVTYVQFCKPGEKGNANAAISKIMAVNETNGTIGYPNGDPRFAYIWASRAGYTYSAY